MQPADRPQARRQRRRKLLYGTPLKAILGHQVDRLGDQRRADKAHEDGLLGAGTSPPARRDPDRVRLAGAGRHCRGGQAAGGGCFYRPNRRCSRGRSSRRR
eukprot:364670-Chlamydomonas_euryale.AAC.6